MGQIGGFLKRRGRQAGVVSQAKGDANEMKVKSSLQRASRPWWLTSARLAPQHLDQRGIDVIVETADIGPLHLQVKSSKFGAKMWWREHAADRGKIGVVVVLAADDANTIYGKALGQLILLRESALQTPKKAKSG